MTSRHGQRTASACEACRKRKKKCDGKKPQCISCATYATTCRYPTERPSRKRKYWDQDYVQSLENQVAALTASLDRFRGITAGAPIDDFNALSHVVDDAAPLQRVTLGIDRSPRALADFASGDWRLLCNSKDSPRMFTGPTGRFSIYMRKVVPTFEDPKYQAVIPQSALPPLDLQKSCEILLSVDTKAHLTELFLSSINVYYKFIDPDWLMFSHLFPQNDLALQFLYSAIFAVTSHMSLRVDKDVTTALMTFAERLAMECCQEHLCLPVVQALLILAWYKHTILDSARGYMYHYMAIGLSTHLGIDHQRYYDGELSRSEVAPSVRTFWSMFTVDRIGMPTLGRDVSIPWDITKVPRYIWTVPPEDADISVVAFEAQCQLLELQQQHLDPIYSLNYQSLTSEKRLSCFLKASAAITLFRQQIDPRLLITRTSIPEPPQIIFWISYHSALLNLHRPFLSSSAQRLVEGHDSEASLNVVTTAADSITQLLKQLESISGFEHIPPFTIYHILRATLVHGVNLTATAIETSARLKTLRSLRTCVNALRQVAPTWPAPVDMILSFIDDVMQSWGLDPILWQ